MDQELSPHRGLPGQPVGEAAPNAILNVWPEMEGEADGAILGDLALQWRCDHVEGKGQSHPGMTDMQLVDWIKRTTCAACDWTIERCAPATIVET